ncbi:hypothetical protein ACUXST_001562 [Sphingomonas sp. F9_3S_D5_B_2]
MLTFAAGLALGSQALGQSTPTQNPPATNTTATPQTPPPATTNTPAPNTVGPRELQNFSLGGTVTRPADGPAPGTAPARRNAASRSAPAAGSAAPPEGPDAGATPRRTAPAAPRSEAPRPSPSATLTPAPDFTTTPGTTFPTPSSTTPESNSPPAFVPETDSAPVSTSSRGPSLLPWLLAAVALAGGAVFLWWRRRPREAFAGGPQVDAYVRPEPPAPRPVPSPRVPNPAPAPRAAPTPIPGPGASAPLAPPRPEPPNSVGIVSSRLRPWLEVTLVPTECRLDGEQVAIEFEIDLLNSGGAPARDILVEATLFNAGPTQEQDIGAFMAKPRPEGEPLAAIPPLQRINFRTSLIAPRANLQLFEMGGRHVFVPVLAFNAMYRWSGGEGQTSGSYLIGRDTGSEKLAPLRADAGPSAFRGLGARPLPTGVRK